MGPLLMALIGYLSRRRAIGGWLLLFYIGLVAGSAFIILMAMPSLKNLNPDEWDPFYWWLAVLDYIPWLLAYLAALILGIRAAFLRDQKALMQMRIAMVALVVTSWIGVYISFQFFVEDSAGSFMSTYSAVAASLWCIYWFVSRRVKNVMTLGDNEWDYDAFVNTR